MKTLIQSLALACLSLCITTHSFGEDAKDKAEKKADKKAELSHIAKKDGKLWVMKEGKNTELTESVTLNDGTKVNPDGTYVEKDGDSKTLKEGEAINWKGDVKDHEKLMKDIEKHKEKKAEKAAKEAEKATDKKE